MNDTTRPYIGQPTQEPDADDFPDGSIGRDAINAGNGVRVQLVPQVNSGQMQVVDPNPLAMLASALQQGHDVDKLGKLMDLAERYEANQARKEYAAAMSKFQSSCPPIVENKVANVVTDKGSYSYSYADLDCIMATVRPALKKCGLSVTFDTEVAEDGTSIRSLCHVMHRSGHVETRRFVAPVDKALRMNDSQKMGSANTYANRYNVLNALGLTAGEDDDGAAGATNRGAAPAPKAANLDEFFPIGKHKGQPWDQVPLDYLEWAVANLTEKPDVVARCKQQLELRMAADDPSPPPEGELSMAECARGITHAKTSKELADIWSLVPDKHRDGLAAYYATRNTELG